MRRKVFISIILLLAILTLNTEAETDKLSLQIKDIDRGVTYYKIESKKEGPTAIITAGIHGDEPAGHFAAERLKQIKINCGRLYIFPTINKSGLHKNSRYYTSNVDLNRCFPGTKRKNKGEILANSIFEFIKKRADIVIDLHESQHFAKEDSDYYGQSIIAGTNNKSILYTMNVIDKINNQIHISLHEFIVNSHPVKNSLIWAVDQKLNKPAFMVETCKEMKLKTRIEYQLLVTKSLLKEAGVKIDE